jgi:hypothetical protein
MARDQITKEINFSGEQHEMPPQNLKWVVRLLGETNGLLQMYDAQKAIVPNSVTDSHGKNDFAVQLELMRRLIELDISIKCPQ